MITPATAGSAEGLPPRRDAGAVTPPPAPARPRANGSMTYFSAMPAVRGALPRVDLADAAGADQGDVRHQTPVQVRTRPPVATERTAASASASARTLSS